MLLKSTCTHGVSDIGSKLLFRFRSGTHGLNEKLGRHSTRSSSKACVFTVVCLYICNFHKENLRFTF